MTRVEIGDIIKIKNQNGQYTKWANKKWIVTGIAYSGQAYDYGFAPQALVSCKGLPVSLYEYEFDVVEHKVHPKSITKKMRMRS